MGMFDHLFEPGYGESQTEGVDYYMSPEGYRVYDRILPYKTRLLLFEWMQTLSVFAQSHKRQPKTSPRSGRQIQISD